MDKIKVKISKKLDSQMNLNGSDIFVNPIISIDEQSKIRNACSASFFGKDGKWEEYLFEITFRYAILDLKTNIDFSNIGDEELDILIWGEFYDRVSSSILNYRDVYNSVSWSISNEIKKFENQNSLVGILNQVVEKIMPIIEQLKDISPENLEEMKSVANTLIENMKQEPVAKIIDDMNGNKGKRKPKKDKEYVQ